ncbi:hypothetical protein ACFL1H_00375 [Nanoarchaeota archaeon]
MYKLETFRKKIIENLSEKIYDRMEEQVNSNDYINSNCMGLVAYTLGLTDSNRFMEYKELLELLMHNGGMCGRYNTNGCFEGKPWEGNVILFEDYEFFLPVHSALYIGKIFLFQQFAPEGLKDYDISPKPMFEKKGRSRIEKIEDRDIWASKFYKIRTDL